MYRKNIEHIVNTSLRYFFNFDFPFFEHTLLFAVIAICLFRFIATQIGSEFHDSALTVKADIDAVKAASISMRERWNSSELHKVVVNSFQLFSNELHG